MNGIPFSKLMLEDLTEDERVGPEILFRSRNETEESNSVVGLFSKAILQNAFERHCCILLLMM